VSCGLGVGVRQHATRGRCPESVALLTSADLNSQLTFRSESASRTRSPLRCKILWMMCGSCQSGSIYEALINSPRRLHPAHRKAPRLEHEHVRRTPIDKLRFACWTFLNFFRAGKPIRVPAFGRCISFHSFPFDSGSDGNFLPLARFACDETTTTSPSLNPLALSQFQFSVSCRGRGQRVDTINLSDGPH